MRDYVPTIDIIFFLRLLNEGGVGERGDEWEKIRLKLLNNLKEEKFLEEGNRWQVEELPARDGAWLIINEYKERRYEPPLDEITTYISQWVLLEEELKKEFERRWEVIRKKSIVEVEDIFEAGIIGACYRELSEDIIQFLKKKFESENNSEVLEVVLSELELIALNRKEAAEDIANFLKQKFEEKKSIEIWSVWDSILSTLENICIQYKEVAEKIAEFVMEKFENENIQTASVELLFGLLSDSLYLLGRIGVHHKDVAVKILPFLKDKFNNQNYAYDPLPASILWAMRDIGLKYKDFGENIVEFLKEKCKAENCKYTRWSWCLDAIGSITDLHNLTFPQDVIVFLKEKLETESCYDEWIEMAWELTKGIFYYPDLAVYISKILMKKFENENSIDKREEILVILATICDKHSPYSVKKDIIKFLKRKFDDINYVDNWEGILDALVYICRSASTWERNLKKDIIKFLKNMLENENHKNIRKEIFEAIEIIKKIKEDVKNVLPF